MCSDRLGSRNARCSPPPPDSSRLWSIQAEIPINMQTQPTFFFLICMNSDLETTASADACEWTCGHVCKQRRRADGYCCTAADSDLADYLSLKLGFLFSEEVSRCPSTTSVSFFSSTGLKWKDKEWLIEASMTANPPTDTQTEMVLLFHLHKMYLLFIFTAYVNRIIWHLIKSLWSGTNILMFIDLPDLNEYCELTL